MTRLSCEYLHVAPWLQAPCMNLKQGSKGFGPPAGGPAAPFSPLPSLPLPPHLPFLPSFPPLDLPLESLPLLSDLPFPLESLPPFPSLPPPLLLPPLNAPAYQVFASAPEYWLLHCAKFVSACEKVISSRIALQRYSQVLFEEPSLARFIFLTSSEIGGQSLTR